MRRRRRKTSLIALRENNEINITSLMDIIVILLFAFIITMPIIEQSLPVNLPKGKAEAMDLTQKHHTIELSIKNGLTLDGAAMSVQRLEEKMKTIGAANPKVAVYVRADEKLDYGQVVEVMRILNAAGIKTMKLVTQAE
ncbi:MAG: biopolymer transporter ExbD [Kiritimatiellaceae bacterium]|nr:biopolymer transporter ExbD [Kiritimatiellaceae bacterium]